MIDWAAIGGGRMASALLRGCLAAGHLQPEQIAVADPNPQVLRHWQDAGCQTFAAADQLPEARSFLLCVKPQDLAAAAAQLAASRQISKSLTVSIVAGIGTETLQKMLGSDKIVRTMPNTPAQIGAGCTFAYATPAASNDKQPVKKLFESVGKLFWVENEELIDVATAISGSGPAYAFALIEAISEAGAKLGMERDIAVAATAQSLRGAAAMVLELKENPAILRAKVTSKGGTTEAAMAVLSEKGFSDAVQQAVRSAHQRAEQLAESARGKKKN